ncbi:hypothetical protein [Brevundimonas sp.]|uniref:hypothetical protein n=1 Tax=Brevundimonas sp. TaxID=1871086 RepID=UPI002D39A9EA|nr:hypothetical protein [Brevundimonas sp.]HYC67489.1 hypothetical protein [Brevundimonas sp.]
MSQTVSQPGEVAFSCREIPGSYFYEVAVRLGDQRDEIGGSRVFIGPEDALMKAVLILLAGDWDAVAPFPAESDDFTLTLRMFHPEDGVRDNRLENPCELIWSEVDRHSQPIETRSLGVAPSTLQLAEAAYAFGQTYYADKTPSAALVALGAALSAIRSAAPPY